MFNFHAQVLSKCFIFKALKKRITFDSSVQHHILILILVICTQMVRNFFSLMIFLRLVPHIVTSFDPLY